MKKNEKKHCFDKFTEFTKIDALRAVQSERRNDSTFINIAIRDLYRNDLSVLKNFNLSGRTSKKGGQKKHAFPEEQVSLLKSIFWARLTSIDAADKSVRSSDTNLRKLIRNAITNISK